MAARSRISMIRHTASEISSVRIQIDISPQYTQEPIIQNLLIAHDLDCVILSAFLKPGQWGTIDLELKGTPDKIRSGLNYLSNLEVVIRGKPNTAGDSWH